MQADESHPTWVSILHNICTDISISVIDELNVLIDVDRCRMNAVYRAEKFTVDTSSNASWPCSCPFTALRLRQNRVTLT